MYNVGLDTNGYFTGSYATVGGVANGVDIAILPDETDCLKLKAYKVIQVEHETVSQVPVVEKYIYSTTEADGTDDEGNPVVVTVPDTVVVTDAEIEAQGLTDVYERNQTDSGGNIVYEDVTSTVMQNEWQFDAERYEELVEEYNSIVPEKTDAEKISDLQEGNAALKEQLEMLDGTLTCILEDVLPSVMAGDGA